ncbi:uncharacterized protein LOC109408284 [Aedes albopictus]|uniref:CCHC-type domain-containing protein n=1 Tax=Aedes albopictus TaxID=7160 RepID=A0ABM1YQ77_AEDAL|nr:uncharacterized protein LOC109408284 [Aedes albopictus]XP_029709654.1 uncharacterized protein LOC109408284 [Aedes albopictus]
MALIGTIDPYVPGTSFSNYVELIEYFFSSNNIVEERKKDVFMSCAGLAVFEELKLLYPATDLKTLSYAEITKKLKERLDKIDSEIMLRYKFRCRRQSPTESGENYVLAVKHLAESCDFGAFRDSAIRDQLVFGVYNRELQKRLLNEEELSLKSAERIIKGFEMANNNSQYFAETGAAVGVNSVRNRLGNRQSRVERRDRSRSRSRDRNYGRNEDGRSSYRRMEGRSRSGHRNVSRGRYANFVCNFCRKRGHIQKNCYRFKNSQGESVNSVKEDTASKEVHDYFKRLRVDYSSESEDEDLCRIDSRLGPQGAGESSGSDRAKA